MDIIKFAEQYAIDYSLFGSRAIKTSLETNDYDWILLVEDVNSIDHKLQMAGYKRSSNYIGKEFTSYRHGDYNVILTDNTGFFDCTILATRLAELLGCKTKQERIIVYNTVMHSNGFEYKNSGAPR